VKECAFNIVIAVKIDELLKKFNDITKLYINTCIWWKRLLRSVNAKLNGQYGVI
jgi:hypothetical protein